MRIIYKNYKQSRKPEDFEDDNDYKHSWGTKNRGYKLETFDEEEDEEFDFFAFISTKTHYVYDLITTDLYPKFEASSFTLRYPSLQYRSCTFPSNNDGAIFVPMFKCLQEFTMGFYVRMLVFSGYREKETTTDPITNTKNEIIHNDTELSPVGYVSPIFITESNMYPVSSGMSVLWNKSGNNPIEKSFTFNTYSGLKPTDTFIISKINIGKIYSHVYKYNTTPELSIYGWKNMSPMAGKNLEDMFLVLGYMRCLSWDVLSYTTYMMSFLILMGGINRSQIYTISPIFFPTLIFYPIPHVIENANFYNAIGSIIEGFLIALQNDLNIINNKNDGNNSINLASNNLIISPKLGKNGGVIIKELTTIPLRPLCNSVTYRGFLPYFIQQSS